MKKMKFPQTARQAYYFLIFSLTAFAIAGSGCSYFSVGRVEIAEPAAVSTLAGLKREFGEPYGLAVRNGEIYVADGEAGKIFRVGLDGSVELFASGLSTPSDIEFDNAGSLIVADTGSHTIKKIDQDGTVTTIAGREGFAGSTDGAATEALFNGPIGIAITESKVYVADTYNDRVRVIENNVISTVAGGKRGSTDGPGNTAMFDTPCDVAVLPNGNIIVADSGNGRIRIIDASGTVSTLAGTKPGEITDGLLSNAVLFRPISLRVDEFGSLWFTDGNSMRQIRNGAVPVIKTVAGGPQGYADSTVKDARFNRPSGIAAANGKVFVADSENRVVRLLSGDGAGKVAAESEIAALRESAEELRAMGSPRWPYEPPDAARDVAGTLGEIRGDMDGSGKPVWFHNGFDIAGAYGETAYFIRNETILRPFAAENFGTLRELVRLPTMGYIHIRLGRDPDNRPFGDDRFQFETDISGRLSDVRVRRGTVFRAGDRIGTLNAMNHVHLIAGRSGSEINAIAALELPGISDTRLPVIEKVEFYDDNWQRIETGSGNSRITIAGKIRIVIQAYDQMDGNPERRKLGVYRAGYNIDGSASPAETDWKISFDRMPPNDAVPFVYAVGSRSGYTPGTAFRYIVTNEVHDDLAREGFLDTDALQPGEHVLRVFVSDYFGNYAVKEILIEVKQ